MVLCAHTKRPHTSTAQIDHCNVMRAIEGHSTLVERPTESQVARPDGVDRPLHPTGPLATRLIPRLYALTKIKPGESATARLKVLQTATFENPQITIPGNPPCFDAVSAYTKRAGALRGSGQMVISKPPGASLKPPAPSPSPL